MKPTNLQKLNELLQAGIPTPDAVKAIFFPDLMQIEAINKGLVKPEDVFNTDSMFSRFPRTNKNTLGSLAIHIENVQGTTGKWVERKQNLPKAAIVLDRLNVLNKNKAKMVDQFIELVEKNNLIESKTARENIDYLRSYLSNPKALEAIATNRVELLSAVLASAAAKTLEALNSSDPKAALVVANEYEQSLRPIVYGLIEARAFTRRLSWGITNWATLTGVNADDPENNQNEENTILDDIQGQIDEILSIEYSVGERNAFFHDLALFNHITNVTNESTDWNIGFTPDPNTMPVFVSEKPHRILETHKNQEIGPKLRVIIPASTDPSYSLLERKMNEKTKALYGDATALNNHKHILDVITETVAEFAGKLGADSENVIALIYARAIFGCSNSLAKSDAKTVVATASPAPDKTGTKTTTGESPLEKARRIKAEKKREWDALSAEEQAARKAEADEKKRAEWYEKLAEILKDGDLEQLKLIFGEEITQAVYHHSICKKTKETKYFQKQYSKPEVASTLKEKVSSPKSPEAE